MNRPIVFYHADCLDGFGAALAAWYALGDAAHFRPMHYGMRRDPSGMAGADLLVLDFSFPPDELYAMAAHARSVLQIDHHATARDMWADRLHPSGPGKLHTFSDPQRGVAVSFDMEKSGARLAWEHFFPARPVPRALLLIEDQDLWRFALPDSRAFCAALRLLPFEFDVWKPVLEASERIDDALYCRMIDEGDAIVRFQQAEIERLAAGKLVTPVLLPGADGPVSGLAINASALFTSELGDRLARRSGTFGLVWNLAADGEVKASLRACGKVDVARLAEGFGGGGHPNAAGFRLPVAAFLPLLELTRRE